MRRFLFSMLAVWSITAPAMAAQIFIDFEEVVPKNEGLPGTSFNSKGIVFDWAGLSPSIPAILGQNNWAGGSGFEMAFCGHCDNTNGTSFYTANGTSFELDSFRFGGTNNGATNLPYTGTVTGFLAGGGTVSQSFSVAAATSTLISFDDSWAQLSSVTLIVDAANVGREPFNGFAIDNLQVQAVPLPAAVWLFASGLGLLGWMRRKMSA